MTLSEFKEQLDAAYSTEIPKVQLDLIGKMTDRAMHDGAYRHFLEFVLERCERRPTAATIKGLLADYQRSAPADSSEHGEDDCKLCNGFRFIQSRFTGPDGREYTQSAMCRCHAGYGQ